MWNSDVESVAQVAPDVECCGMLMWKSHVNTYVQIWHGILIWIPDVECRCGLCTNKSWCEILICNRWCWRGHAILYFVVAIFWSADCILPLVMKRCMFILLLGSADASATHKPYRNIILQPRPNTFVLASRIMYLMVILVFSFHKDFDVGISGGIICSTALPNHHLAFRIGEEISSLPQTKPTYISICPQPLFIISPSLFFGWQKITCTQHHNQHAHRFSIPQPVLQCFVAYQNLDFTDAKITIFIGVPPHNRFAIFPATSPWQISYIDYPSHYQHIMASFYHFTLLWNVNRITHTNRNNGHLAQEN